MMDRQKAGELKFPVVSIGTAVVLTVVSILSFFVYTQQAFKALNDVHNTNRAIVKANLETVWYDEALTMSARLAAATGNTDWIGRYESYLKPMDEAIARQKALAPVGLAARLDREIKEANAALVALETQALDHVTAGRLREATALLYGPGYERNKTELLDSTDRFAADLKAGAVATLAAKQDQGRTALWLGAGALAVIGIAWATLIRTLIGWRRDLEQEQRRRTAAVQAVARQEADRDSEQRHYQSVRARQQVLETSIGSFRSKVAEAMLAVSGSLDELSSVSGALDREAGDLRMSSESITRQIGSTLDGVAGVTEATDQLATSIAEIAGQVSQSRKITADAVTRSQMTDQQIANLSSAIDRIGNFVGLIRDIAEQTNLLALNATIEAARAGDAGKGFAVVAGEVKQLATQSATATEDISAQISAVQEAAKASVDRIAEVGRSIGAIEKISAGVAAAIEQQSVSTHRISDSARVLSGQSREAQQEVTAVAGRVEALSGYSAQLTRAVNRVTEERITLETSVGNSVQEVRA